MGSRHVRQSQALCKMSRRRLLLCCLLSVRRSARHTVVLTLRPRACTGGYGYQGYPQQQAYGGGQGSRFGGGGFGGGGRPGISPMGAGLLGGGAGLLGGVLIGDAIADDGDGGGCGGGCGVQALQSAAWQWRTVCSTLQRVILLAAKILPLFVVCLTLEEVRPVRLGHEFETC